MPKISNSDMSVSSVRKKKPIKHASRRNKRKVVKGSHPETPEPRRRMDWEIHQALIEKVFVEFFQKKNRAPTQQELADKTDLSRDTVRKHLDGKGLNDLLKPYKVLAGAVMGKIAMRAVEEGDVPSAKLYFEKAWDSGEKVEVNHSFESLRERKKGVEAKDKKVKEIPELSGLVSSGKK